MIRNIVNLTQSTIVLDDLKGMTVAAGATVDGLAFGEFALRNSTAVMRELLAGAIVISDGNNTYEAQRGVDLLRGTVEQLTRDGKRIFTTSDRPQDHYRHFTGCGDNMTNHTRGDGAVLIWEVNPEEDPEHIDAQFLDPIYLKDGHIKYENAELGSWFNVEIYCPAYVPFPMPNGTGGNRDLVNGQFVVNNTNTGAYMVLAQETLLNRFINRMPLLGNGEREALSPEPVLIPSPYILRFNVHSTSTTQTMRVILTLGMYRKTTI